MHLYLIRHAKSVVNTGVKLPREALDAGLTDLGRQQAQALSAWLPGHLPEIDVMYASTMKRARETAEYLEAVYGMRAAGDDRLREIGNNRLDASPLPSDRLPDQYWDLSPNHFPFTPVAPTIPHSETSMHFRARVGLFLDEIIRKHPGQAVLVVAHGGTVNAVADAVFNVGAYRRHDIRVANTSYSHFEYRGPNDWETWLIHSIGRVDHLVGVG